MIIINDEAALRVKCEDVQIEEVSELVSILEKELENSNRLGNPGIGLAAPQIGIAKKIAIVRAGNIKINLINCNIKEGYDKALFKDEGCLSFPGRLENTMRFQEIVVENNLTYPHTFIASGLIAVVIQHELDHINQTLFMDRKIMTPSLPKKKVGPNDPCECGSKIKSKKCCGRVK